MGQMDEIFGATLVGAVVTAWLLGLICILSFQYYTKYPRDPLITKILVGFLWFVQALNTAVVTALIYYYLVTSYNTPQNLASATWAWSTFIVLETITASCVQLFYAQRVLGLSRSYVITGIIVILSVGQLAFGLGTSGVTIRIKFFDKFIPWTWISLSWLSCSAACDIVITATQVFYLVRNRSNVPQTRRMVAKLMLSIIATGALTTIVAILEVFTFAFLGFNFVHVFLSYPNGSVYVISLLANLHIRKSARNDNSNIISMESTINFKHGQSRTAGGSQHSQMRTWVSTAREDDSTLGRESATHNSRKWDDETGKDDIGVA
ncbi:hypothetical protein PM082_010851 [Marasmius tenuissimus]|nr:hypothetical protein PM082_010851 [Marasmius tenuissimus]